MRKNDYLKEYLWQALEKDRDDYYRRKENAVTVVATLEHSFVNTRDEVKWDIGAGADVNKEVITHVYKNNKYVYTYNGQEYSYVVQTSSTIRTPEGTTRELQIDPENPSVVFETFYPENKPSYFATALCGCSFIGILIIWAVTAFRKTGN